MKEKLQMFGKGWRIIHLPTGWVLTTCATKRQVEHFLAALCALPVPWQSKSPARLRRYKTVIGAMVPPQED